MRPLRPILLASAVAVFNVGVFQPPASAKEAPTAPNVYPPEVVNAFTEACVSGAGKTVDPKVMQQICTCTIGEIQAQYTLEEFVAVANTMEKTNTLPAPVNQMVESCTMQAIQ
jgi:hypothetical protein